MMKLRYISGLIAVGLATAAGAQAPRVGWADECWDITVMDPPPQYSTNYISYYITNGLFAAQHGVQGTSTWGGNGTCAPYFDPAKTLNAAGRLGFSYGATGSIQTDFDDHLALTMGAPTDPVGDFCYAMITKDTNDPATSALYGDGGLTLAFVGASKRYFRSVWSDADVEVQLTVRTLGDAAVVWWEITNLGETARPLGLHFAVWGAQHTGLFQPDTQTFTHIAFASQAFNFGFPKVTAEAYAGWLTAPTVHPVRTEYLFKRASAKFPAYADFLHGQTHNYGMRLTNIPDATMQKLYPDPLNPFIFRGASTADMMNLGGDYRGTIEDNAIDFPVFEDPDPNGSIEKSDVLNVNKSAVQQYPVQTVQAGATRAIIQVIKSNWGVADYNDPYAAVIDAPMLVNADPTGQDGLNPNPMTIRAYVDNQFAKLDQPVTLQNTRFIITLPQGLTLAPGEIAEKVVPAILPNALGFVEWVVESDGNTFGDLPVTITFDPTPGPVKTLTAIVRVASTPRIRIASDAQMVTFPYEFADNSLGAVLGLTPDIDFRAYKWDPGQAAYLPASTANRGEGLWIVPTNDEGYIDLNGATRPADTPIGGLLYTMQRGWNMIGNPYNYPMPLSNLVAVVDDAPQDSFTWSEIVALGFVNSALAHWDRGPTGDGAGSYKFTTSQAALMEPHKAYWIFVNTFLPIRLAWPPVLIGGLSGSGRGEETLWPQTERQWRLQLSARTSSGSDVSNYVAYVSDSNKLEGAKIPKPPKAFNAPVELLIEGELNGELTRLAQAVTDRKTRTEFRVHVNNAGTGDVTVTWPNLASVPRNVRAKLTDVATGEVRDMRAVSGYTYFMNQVGSREFVVTIEQGGSARPVIGNVVVSQTRGISDAPMTISYALSADALVSVRVLSGSGKEVFTVSRGRADNAGENQVTWNLRDNANRAVAPGTYRVEILAETPNGERVRKIVPVNVIR